MGKAKRNLQVNSSGRSLWTPVILASKSFLNNNDINNKINALKIQARRARPSTPGSPLLCQSTQLKSLVIPSLWTSDPRQAVGIMKKTYLAPNTTPALNVKQWRSSVCLHANCAGKFKVHSSASQKGTFSPHGSHKVSRHLYSLTPSWE